MYKVSYYISSSAIRFKSFQTFHEASLFANKLKPIDSVLEIKYYDEHEQRKPDRN